MHDLDLRGSVHPPICTYVFDFTSTCAHLCYPLYFSILHAISFALVIINAAFVRVKSKCTTHPLLKTLIF